MEITGLGSEYWKAGHQVGRNGTVLELAGIGLSVLGVGLYYSGSSFGDISFGFASVTCYFGYNLSQLGENIQEIAKLYFQGDLEENQVGELLGKGTVLFYWGVKRYQHMLEHFDSCEV